MNLFVQRKRDLYTNKKQVSRQDIKMENKLNSNIEYLLDIKQGYAIVNNKKIGIKILKILYILILIRLVLSIFGLIASVGNLISYSAIHYTSAPVFLWFLLVFDIVSAVIDGVLLTSKYTHKGLYLFVAHYTFFVIGAFLHGCSYDFAVALASASISLIYAIVMIVYIFKREDVFNDRNAILNDHQGILMNQLTPEQKIIIENENNRAKGQCRNIKESIVDVCVNHRGERVFLKAYLDKRAELGDITSTDRDKLFTLFERPIYVQQQIDNAPVKIIEECRKLGDDKERIEKYLDKQFGTIERYNLEIIRNYFCYDASGLLKEPDSASVVTITKPVKNEQGASFNDYKILFTDDVKVKEHTNPKEKFEPFVPTNNSRSDYAGLISVNANNDLVSSDKCPKCGAALVNGAQFCNKCGTKIDATKLFCRKCGQPLFDDSEFCHKCGAEVKGR